MLVGLGGCYASDRRIDPPLLRAVERVRIVAMAPPPLLLPAQPYGAHLAGIGFGTQLFPLTIVGGLVAAVDLPAAFERADDHAAAIEREMAMATWVPTAVFAAQLQQRLAAAHPQWAIATAPGVVPVPGVVDTGRTWHMRNWIGPVYDWYAAEPTPRTATAPPRELEVAVGLAQYEVYSGCIFAHVFVKVATAEGNVLGRARAMVAVQLSDASDVLTDAAAGLKRAIEDAGKQALDEITATCGLVP